MALVRYRFSPSRMMPLWPWRQMERMMEELAGWRRRPTEVEAERWTPNVEIHQTDHELTVAAELPGMKREEVMIEATPESLTVSGQRRAPEGVCPEGGVCCTEFCYGPFERTIPWPMEVKAAEAKASLHDGILEVRVPLADEAKTARPTRVAIE